ncbi:hypothetical protein Tco_1234662 [Tanacetum coccineum]
MSSLQNLDKELSFASQLHTEKSQEDETEKTNAKAEVQSMIMVPIHQDTYSVPLMTTLVIDLTVSQPVLTVAQTPLPTLTTTCISELEQHMADLVSKVVDEIITDAVDWAIQTPLRDRFRDLLEANMKEILYHRMWESNSYQAHEDHKQLYEALEKSMACPSGTSGASGAFGSSQFPPSPPPPSTNQSDQSTSTAAPSSSKTAASAEYTAWTTTDIRLKPFVSSIPEELHMDDDTTPDK